MISSFFSEVPFYPVSKKVFPDIYKALHLKEGSVVYDLGSGDGRLLFYLIDKYPNIEYIGIENNLFPIILTYIRIFIRKIKNKKNPKIIFKNFHKVDLSNATHIYSYLYPKTMDQLLGKLEKELKPGVIFISATFKFTLKKEIIEIDLLRKKTQLTRMLYIYEF